MKLQPFLKRQHVGMNHIITHQNGAIGMTMAQRVAFGKVMAGLKNIANGAMTSVGNTTEVFSLLF